MNLKITSKNKGAAPYLRQFSVINDNVYFSIDLHFHYLRIVNDGDIITSIQLFNELGHTLYDESPLEESTINIPLAELSKGIYYLKLETDSKKYNRKIYIE